MDLAYLEQLIGLVARSPISELELARQDGWRVRLVKTGTGSAGDVVPAAQTVRGDADKEGTLPAEEPRAPRGGAGMHVVAAGIVGTFYHASAPDKPPFVAVGDTVEEGQTLGVLEAMKTFIPVEADCAGRIAAILAENEASMRPGDPLFGIEPSA